jgi:hypothetical protein
MKEPRSSHDSERRHFIWGKSTMGPSCLKCMHKALSFWPKRVHVSPKLPCSFLEAEMKGQSQKFLQHYPRPLRVVQRLLHCFSGPSSTEKQSKSLRNMRFVGPELDAQRFPQRILPCQVVPVPGYAATTSETAMIQYVGKCVHNDLSWYLHFSLITHSLIPKENDGLGSSFRFKETKGLCS